MTVRVRQLARHRGASIVDADVGAGPGADAETIHLWFDGPADDLRRRWDATLVVRALAGPLHLSAPGDAAPGPGRGRHAWATSTPFVPLDVVQEALRRTSLGRAPAAALDLLAHDAAIDQRSVAVHHVLASAHGWPSLRGQIGAEPATLLGMGRHAAVLVRNLHEAVGAPIVVGGRDKVAARNLLELAGLAVPPGRVVGTAADGVAWARGREPVVVKGAGGGNGDTVFLGLRRPADIRTALTRVLAGRPHAIVEEQVDGDEVRVHVAAGEVVAVFRPEPVVVVGDGARTVAQLIAAARPTLWSAISTTAWLQRRTAQHCWHLGARRFSDLDRLVPPQGVPVVVAPGTGDGMAEVDRDVVHTDDRRRIEALFRRFGPASGALDVVLVAPGRRISEGGAVLDLNVPCGSAYLGDRLPDIANRELERWLPVSFREAGGRVPLVLVPRSTGPDRDGRAADAGRETARWFASVYPGGQAHDGVDGRGWWPVLDDRAASALLVSIDAETVLDHGLPRQARPVLVDPTGAAPGFVVDAVGRAGGVVHRAALTVPAGDGGAEPGPVPGPLSPG